MTQLRIPLIDRSVIANREEQRKLVKNADGLVKVPFDKITVREGFNRRTDFYEIEELAASIEQIGLKVPLTVDVLKDGLVVLTDGERRYRAIKMIREQHNNDIPEYDSVLCMINDRDISELDRLCVMMSTQSAKAFHPLDEAEAFQQMKTGYMGTPGLSITEIAARVGRSVPYVEQRLLLAEMSSEEKKLIRDGKMTSTAAVELMRREENPEARVEKVKEANAKGKKLKVKDVKVNPILYLCEDILKKTKELYESPKNYPDEINDFLLMVDQKVRSIKGQI